MSEENKMSITRALKELSLLDGRINSAIKSLNVVDFKQDKYKGKALKSGQSVNDFEKNVESKYQSLNDLISRRDNLKRAIVTSNANTKVKIGNQSMTVADAIERKNSISYKTSLLNTLKSQYNTALNELTNSRARLDQQVNSLVEQNTGKDRKIDKDDYEKIAKPFIEANEIKLVDPLKVQQKIELLESEIETFLADVDIVLSESNAKTEVTI